MLKNYFQRIRTLDRLIQRKATGTPAQLARRLNISRSRLYDYLLFLKDEGAPVRYSRERQTYYYETSGTFTIGYMEN